MKKNVRMLLILAAVFMIAVAGLKIGSAVRQNEAGAEYEQAAAYEQTAAVEQTAADIGGHQEGIFHLDIIAWELTIIGCGYLIWAAVSWNDKQKRRYQNLEKNGYATQE